MKKKVIETYELEQKEKEFMRGLVESLNKFCEEQTSCASCPYSIGHKTACECPLCILQSCTEELLFNDGKDTTLREDSDELPF